METDPTALQLIALLQEDLKKLFRMRFGEVFIRIFNGIKVQVLGSLFPFFLIFFDAL